MRVYDFPDGPASRRTLEASELAEGDERPGKLPAQLPHRFEGRWYYLHDGSNVSVISFEVTGGRLTRTVQDYVPAAASRTHEGQPISVQGLAYFPVGKPGEPTALAFSELLEALVRGQAPDDAWLPEKSRVALSRLPDSNPEAPY
jgi:hypothetical protein